MRSLFIFYKKKEKRSHMILNLTRCPPHRVFVLWVLKVCTLIFCTNGIGPPVLTIWLYILSIYDYMTLYTEYICLYDSIYWVYDQMNSICDQLNSICPPLYTDFWDFVFVPGGAWVPAGDRTSPWGSGSRWEWASQCASKASAKYVCR